FATASLHCEGTVYSPGVSRCPDSYRSSLVSCGFYRYGVGGWAGPRIFQWGGRGAPSGGCCAGGYPVLTSTLRGGGGCGWPSFEFRFGLGRGAPFGLWRGGGEPCGGISCGGALFGGGAWAFRG